MGWEANEKAVREAEWVEAPDLMIAESANVCWKYHMHGNQSLENCEKALEQAIALPDEFVPASGLYREAFALAAAGQRPAYDMFFLALARRNNAVLISLDKGLLAFAAKHDVKILG
ncbi:MAG: type II toxin-antitoxin system VapC family toxin [Fibrobacterota bacterium]|nr:type II toxin-antitoxin system VapC family toxin [Fibrobacterota bacterium]